MHLRVVAWVGREKGVEGRKSQSEVGGLHRMAKGGSDKEGSKICKSIKGWLRNPWKVMRVWQM
jgi:hypothetical protein